MLVSKKKTLASQKDKFNKNFFSFSLTSNESSLTTKFSFFLVTFVKKIFSLKSKVFNYFLLLLSFYFKANKKLTIYSFLLIGK
jgi:hypothetical protein